MEKYSRRDFFRKLGKAAVGIGIGLGFVSLVKADESLGNTANIEYESNLSEATSVKPRRPQGYYQDWENFEREMREAIKANKGEFPTAKILLLEMPYNYGQGDRTIGRIHGPRQKFPRDWRPSTLDLDLYEIIRTKEEINKNYVRKGLTLNEFQQAIINFRKN